MVGEEGRRRHTTRGEGGRFSTGFSADQERQRKEKDFVDRIMRQIDKRVTMLVRRPRGVYPSETEWESEEYIVGNPHGETRRYDVSRTDILGRDSTEFPNYHHAYVVRTDQVRDHKYTYAREYISSADASQKIITRLTIGDAYKIGEYLNIVVEPSGRRVISYIRENRSAIITISPIDGQTTVRIFRTDMDIIVRDHLDSQEMDDIQDLVNWGEFYPQSKTNRRAINRPPS